MPFVTFVSLEISQEILPRIFTAVLCALKVHKYTSATIIGRISETISAGFSAVLPRDIFDWSPEAIENFPVEVSATMSKEISY